ncbi:hypothetical protein IFM89_009500 [Coptis chinensis]|uniref:Uncharacterized protein n=1 Tax=Coptis chinensis TaxID=261450 RepID=A0A835LGR8_9MAGN|nr:hypothetical protein IFM89_009500 [Coptis chinensis]
MYCRINKFLENKKVLLGCNCGGFRADWFWDFAFYVEMLQGKATGWKSSQIWDVPGCRVVDWTDVKEIVTALCYRPDGKGAIVGSVGGNCRFYNVTTVSLGISLSHFNILRISLAWAIKAQSSFKVSSSNDSKTVVYVGREGEGVIGAITISDTLRHDARSTLDRKGVEKTPGWPMLVGRYMPKLVWAVDNPGSWTESCVLNGRLLVKPQTTSSRNKSNLTVVLELGFWQMNVGIARARFYIWIVATSYDILYGEVRVLLPPIDVLLSLERIEQDEELTYEEEYAEGDEMGNLVRSSLSFVSVSIGGTWVKNWCPI